MSERNSSISNVFRTAAQTVDDASSALFGDAYGFAVFLGALVALGATWQVGFVITDTYAVANGMVNVAHGHLTIERLYYSLTLLSQPGLYVSGGELHARNFGQAVLAVPIYYALDLLSGVVDLHLLLGTLWALVVGAFCRQLGVLLGRRDRFATAGSILAALLVVASVPFARPLDPDRAGLVALQILSMLAIGVAALAMYRLGSFVRGRRIGLAAGGATVLATPLWFWAAIPKRHALTAAAVATLLYWFAASREPSGRLSLPVVGTTVSRSLALRAAGYALVGLVAWVHAFEGVVLLGAFAVADLGTASDTSRRALVAIAVATAVGFAPFLATNQAISGNPFEPPRMASGFSPGHHDFSVAPSGEVLGPGEEMDAPTPDEGAETQPDSEGDQSLDEPGGGSTPAVERGGGDSGAFGLGSLERFYAGILGFGETAQSHGESISQHRDSAPERLYRTYLRSGRADDMVRHEANANEAIDVTLLESNPLFGGVAAGFLGGIAVFGRRLLTGPRGSSDGPRSRDWLSPRHWRQSVLSAPPARRTDVFALLVFVGFGAMYFPRLPLHSQITVRYILPVVPALVYLLVRVPAVVEAVEGRPRWLGGSYVASVAVGLLLVTFGLPALDLAVGEAIQLHALVNLSVAAVAALTVLVPTLGYALDLRLRAASLGVCGAATTVLILSMQLEYFEYGTYAVPLSRRLAEAVSILA